MNIQIYTFNELSAPLLYEILKARTAVFVVEQNCVFQDMDDHDQNALHLVVSNEKNSLVAYCRILPPNEIYSGYSSIGRVLTPLAFRNQKYGRTLMDEALKEIKNRYPQNAIKIQAQLYLEAFYHSYGFKEVSEAYVLDDILHVDMVLEL